MPGKEHLLLKFKALIPRCNSSQISSWGVAGYASARAIEILLAGLDVSCLKIGGVYAFASAISLASGACERIVLPCVDKRYEAGDLLVRAIKRWHAFVGAPVTHDCADL